MSTFDWVMQVGTLLGALSGVVWVYVAMITYKGQMNAEVFLQCNERYEQIMQSFPSEAWAVRLHIDTALPEPSIQLTLCALRYLNLSAEEFYLHRRGYINKEVWQ